MAFAPKKILCPVDFDRGSLEAVKSAALIATRSGGTLYLFHVVPLILTAVDSPAYTDVHRGLEESARSRLCQFARKHLAGIDYEVMIRVDEPASAILRRARQLLPDLIVMSTHGRRGISRLAMGSVAARVVREAACPVLTIRGLEGSRDLVRTWMTTDPVTASPGERLSAIRKKMDAGYFRGVPVVENQKLVGMITDRDVRTGMSALEDLEARQVANASVISITPETSAYQAAELLRKYKIGALPVVEDGDLVGLITVTDLLKVLAYED